MLFRLLPIAPTAFQGEHTLRQAPLLHFMCRDLGSVPCVTIDQHITGAQWLKDFFAVARNDGDEVTQGDVYSTR